MKKELVYIPIGRLHPHKDNPRKDLGDLTELADSIKANGILQNLTVVPDDPTALEGDYTVVIGHRRLAAATLAGITEVPCAVVALDQDQQVRTMLMENMQRADLTVYEQAQGFQMMLDMGDTVEDVAKNTGFSQATVRRRVKMMELDQKKLKEVSEDAERQIRLDDFDELAKIEDIKARNKALNDIGTNNFKNSVRSAITEQERKRRKPLAMKWLKTIGAKEIQQSDTYGSKYERIGSDYYIYFSSWDEAKMPNASKVKDGVFYCISYGGDAFSLYKKAKKPPKEKKTPEQIEAEKKIRAAWKTISDIAKSAYELRKEFVDGITMGSKNKVEVLTGAAYAALLSIIDFNSPDRDKVIGVLGAEVGYSRERMAIAWDAYAKMPSKDMAKLVYAFFGDRENETCASTYKSEMPKFQRSGKLEMLYAWLQSLGYVMSDEETSMLNGTHEVYEAAKGDADGK